MLGYHIQKQKDLGLCNKFSSSVHILRKKPLTSFRDFYRCFGYKGLVLDSRGCALVDSRHIPDLKISPIGTLGM